MARAGALGYTWNRATRSFSMDSASESLIGFLVGALPYVLGVLAVVVFVAVLDGRRERSKPRDPD